MSVVHEPPRNLLTDDPMPAIAREGWAIVVAFLAITLALAGVSLLFSKWAGLCVGGVGLVLSTWAIWFFRDPAREIPADPRKVISPADGVISFVGRDQPPVELGIAPEATAGMTRVSVFMNVFNVHVNRSPTAGKIVRIAYRPGKFFNASLDKASEFNERLSLALALPNGQPMVVVQVAGLIARRIVCNVAEGAELKAGQRFGLIRFGSRVDTYLPPGVASRVSIGDVVVAGETVLATLAQDVPVARPAEEIEVITQEIAQEGQAREIA
ncbi:MAG: phosphatidylserine decarboxylase [Planctomycetota bacterium]